VIFEQLPGNLAIQYPAFRERCSHNRLGEFVAVCEVAESDERLRVLVFDLCGRRIQALLQAGAEVGERAFGVGQDRFKSLFSRSVVVDSKLCLRLVLISWVKSPKDLTSLASIRIDARANLGFVRALRLDVAPSSSQPGLTSLLDSTTNYVVGGRAWLSC
jgi:hypothetical protein